MDARYQRVGQELFGRPLRLAVCAWVLEHETFFQGEAAQGVAYQATAVRKELDSLVELGMVVIHPRGPESRRQYFSRVVEHPLWEAIRIVNDHVLQDSVTDSDQRSRIAAPPAG